MQIQSKKLDSVAGSSINNGSKVANAHILEQFQSKNQNFS